MDLTWLGQAGIRVRFSDGRILLLDPYLSDYVAEKEDPALKRLVPVEERYLREKVDVLLLSHSHTDHADPDTLAELFANPENRDMRIFSSFSVWEKLRGLCPNRAQSYSLVPGCEISPWEGVRIMAAPAFHSDLHAISFLLEAEGCRIWFSGDTLYHSAIPEALGGSVDLAFLCINGAGNNMNWRDAVRLTEAVGAKAAVPVHWDMLPGYTADPSPYLEAAAARGIRGTRMEEYVEYPVQALCE